MTEVEKQKYVKEVLKLVEGRLAFSNSKIVNRNHNDIIIGQVKYDFQEVIF